MKKIICYTREPLHTDVYSSKLANSMHLALDSGSGYRALNHNYGILFAKATQNGDGTINAMSLAKPYLFRTDDGFGVIAVRVRSNDDEILPDDGSTGKAVVFKSKDLVHYKEIGFIKLSDSGLEDVMCVPENGGYTVYFRDGVGTFSAETDDLVNATNVKPTELPEILSEKLDIEGAIARNSIELTDDEADYIEKKLTPIYNVGVDVPEKLTVRGKKELHDTIVTAHYSDGSTAKKRIDWYDDKIDFTRPGTYRIRGRVHQDRFEFPFSYNRADPCIGRWQGKYYFIATNDADGNNSMSIRCADTVAGITTAQETMLVNTKMYPHMKSLLWAPEFHIIKDKLYIFHAASPEGFYQERSHVMKLKDDADPMLPESWEMSRPVTFADGRPFYENGITLDMTEFEIEGHYYVVWSQRQFRPVDQGAWLYISEIDPDEPWKIIREPVCISIPDYGWANNHVFVDEGPFALLRENKIFVTFSSALVDSTYVVGVLSADYGTDLLDPKSWTKGNYPIMTSATVRGEYGTGHNSYVIDDDGNVWNAYHGRRGVNGPRSSGIRRVHFDIDGFPVLDMIEARDLDPKFAAVDTEVTVK